MSQQINLYNPALRPRRDLLSPRNVALALAISVFTVLASGGVATQRLAARKQEAKLAADQLKAVQDQVTALSLRIKSAKPDPALQQELARLTEQLEARAAILELMDSGLRQPGQGYSDILAGLARRALPGLWLTDIELSGASRALALRGRTTERTLVSDYLRTLNNEAVFAGRSFAGLNIELPTVEASAKPGAESRAPAYLEFSLTSSASDTGAAKAKDLEPVPVPMSADKEKKS